MAYSSCSSLLLPLNDLPTLYHCGWTRPYFKKMTSRSYQLFMNLVQNYMSNMFYTLNSMLSHSSSQIAFHTMKLASQQTHCRCCMCPLCLCLLYTTMLDSPISSLLMGYCQQMITRTRMREGVGECPFTILITSFLSCDAVLLNKKKTIHKQKKWHIIRLFLTSHRIYA